MSTLPNWVADWWRPIETAPDDGRSFLAADEFGDQWICAKLDGRLIGVGEQSCGIAVAVARGATHWMPLPPRPRVGPVQI